MISRVTRATLPPGRVPFYVPALYGTFGAAAGCARVLGLTAHHTNYALGLAAAFTGGTFQGHEEGAWQRSLNGGMASERGVTAALLAETGFRATELGLEGVQAFAKMYSDGHLDPSVLLDGLGSPSTSPGAGPRRYPMNLTLHAPVEALLKIMREHDPAHGHRADRRRVAEGGALSGEAQGFDGRDRSGQSAVRPVGGRGAGQCRRRRVHRRDGGRPGDPGDDPADDRPPGQRALWQGQEFSMPGRVTVRTQDGREFTDEVLYPKGNPSNPMTEDEFKGKFMDMAAGCSVSKQSDELYARARDLVACEDVAELAPLFSPQ